MSKLLLRTINPRFYRNLSSLLIVYSMIFGCTTNISQPNATVNSHNLTGQSEPNSEVLKLAIIPAISADKQQEEMKALSSYLEKSLGRKVSFQITKDYDEGVDLLVTEKVQIAFLGPLTYVKARARNPQLEAIAAPIDQNTGRPWYTSIIVVDTHKNIKTLADLKGKRFGFVNKSSTSGYLVPTVHLKKSGIEPEQDFSEIKYFGSHDKSVDGLASGLVDAISIDLGAYNQGKKDKIKSEQYERIWESTPIPTSPIVISTKLNPQLISDLKKSLINAPEGLLEIGGTKSAGYTLVQDMDYEPIRQLQQSFATTSGQKK